jgi:hypothetical protein
MSLQVFGVDAVRSAIARGIAIAEYVEQRVKRSAVLQVATPAHLGIVTFRAQGQDTEALMGICNQLRESGFAMLSTTRLKGETVLRMCTINPRTTDQDIDETLTRIEAAAAGPGREAGDLAVRVDVRGTARQSRPEVSLRAHQKTPPRYALASFGAGGQRMGSGKPGLAVFAGRPPKERCP